MRNLSTLIILIYSVCFANAQITIENTYAYSTSVCEVNDADFYFLMDIPENQCRIYNTNHELTKTINLSIPEGYYLTDIKFIGEGLFNSDALLELLYIYEKYISSETGNYFKYGLAVINEEGTSLLSLPNGGWADIKKVSNKNKLLTYSYTYNPEGYYNVSTNIYCIGSSTNASSYVSLEKSLAYPNPTSDNITIETSQLSNLTKGRFDLYNASGAKVLTTPIYKDRNFSLPAAHFPSGVYFYSIRNNSQVISTNKIIIR